MKWISVGDFRIGSEEREAIKKVLDSGRISEGEKVAEFENDFSKYIGTKYTVLVNSGTSAIIAGLMSLLFVDGLSIKPQTNVITTPVTYVATVNAIKLAGFNPVFVDVDRETFVITPENIKKHLENVEDVDKYSIVLPVHLMGYPADMNEITRICKEYGLYSFEDSAQAHGSLYMGKKCGSLSLASAFSFYIAHSIQVGEMGALTTNNPKVAKLARRIKAHGRMCDCRICTRFEGLCPYKRTGNEEFDPRFYHTHIGYNFKTTEFMAALGLVQLKKADWIKKKRQENVKFLNEGLAKISDILQLPKYSEDISYLAYPVVIKKPSIILRNKLMYKLEKNGVEIRPLFSCIPTQQPAYQCLKEKYKGTLPNAEYVGKNGFYIGCHQYLEQEDLNYIISVFERVLSPRVS